MTLDVGLITELKGFVEAYFNIGLAGQPDVFRDKWKTNDPLEFGYGYWIGYINATFTRIFEMYSKRPPTEAEMMEMMDILQTYSDRIRRYLMASTTDSERDKYR